MLGSAGVTDRILEGLFGNAREKALFIRVDCSLFIWTVGLAKTKGKRKGKKEIGDENEEVGEGKRAAIPQSSESPYI